MVAGKLMRVTGRMLTPGGRKARASKRLGRIKPNHTYLVYKRTDGSGGWTVRMGGKARNVSIYSVSRDKHKKSHGVRTRYHGTISMKARRQIYKRALRMHGKSPHLTDSNKRTWT